MNQDEVQRRDNVARASNFLLEMILLMNDKVHNDCASLPGFAFKRIFVS